MGYSDGLYWRQIRPDKPTIPRHTHVVPRHHTCDAPPGRSGIRALHGHCRNRHHRRCRHDSRDPVRNSVHTRDGVCRGRARLGSIAPAHHVRSHNPAVHRSLDGACQRQPWRRDFRRGCAKLPRPWHTATQSKPWQHAGRCAGRRLQTPLVACLLPRHNHHTDDSRLQHLRRRHA